MKIINLIQSMQAAIDALSIHSADTEVRLTSRGYGELTGAIDVSDPAVDGKVTVSLGANAIKFDLDHEALRDLYKPDIGKSPFDRPKLKVTADGNILNSLLVDEIARSSPEVDKAMNTLLRTASIVPKERRTCITPKERGTLWNMLHSDEGGED